MNSKTNLSKSLFIRGLQCHKSLYLHKFHPELRDEIGFERERVFQIGHEVGELAQQLFPGGVEIPYEGLTPSRQIEMTREEIAKGTKVLYEAALLHNGIFMKADILRKGRGGWELYEVKSSTEIKDPYVYDLSLQYHVAKGAGLKISKAFLVYINNEYVRRGDIDVHGLFAMQDLTEVVRSNESLVIKEIDNMKAMLSGEMPKIDIGEHCEDPYECDFMGHCWQHIPGISVFSLRGRGANSYERYRNGFISLSDIPLDELNFHLRLQVEGALEKKNYTDVKGVREFLKSLWYPLYFLDFESFSGPIPPFEGTRPYEQIPFQYSLHYVKSPDGKLMHTEFLAEPNVDPRSALCEKLLSEIPDDACIVAFNKAFEERVLRSLAEWLPQYAPKINKLLGNFVDLAAPFRRKEVYRWQMYGSYSLKAVLPALVPELSYEELEISDGEMAGDAYRYMCAIEDSREREKVRKSLLEYCRLDTLGMVRIVETLRDFVS